VERSKWGRKGGGLRKKRKAGGMRETKGYSSLLMATRGGTRFRQSLVFARHSMRGGHTRDCKIRQIKGGEKGIFSQNASHQRKKTEEKRKKNPQRGSH